eukprot:scaffold85390_cov28-Tisochrysis_lutea.AAC.2
MRIECSPLTRATQAKSGPPRPSRGWSSSLAQSSTGCDDRPPNPPPLVPGLFTRRPACAVITGSHAGKRGILHS